MLDTEEQLARLRQRVAAIDLKFSQARLRPKVSGTPASHLEFDQLEVEPARLAPAISRCSGHLIETWSEGELVTNEHGQHFQMERWYPGHRQHGCADVGALAELPPSFL